MSSSTSSKAGRSAWMSDIMAIRMVGLLGGNRIILSPEPRSDVDQREERGHFNQRTYDACKGLSAVEAEDADGHGYGKLEIIPGGGESDRGRFGIVGTEILPDKETANEHEGEVNHQWYRNAYHVDGYPD